MTNDVAKKMMKQLPGMLGDISKRTVKDQVADKLTYMIGSGLLREGDELPGERELATLLDVSRETIRSAIQVLSTRGLIEVSQGTRSRVLNTETFNFVKSLTMFPHLREYSIQEVYSTRREIERIVLREAAVRMTKATLTRLAELVKQQESMFSDPVRFQISDREFHETIYQSSANPLLANIVGDLYAYALDYRRKVLETPGAIERSWREHQLILSALQTKDPEAAATAVTRHLSSVHATTLTAMSQSIRRKPKNLFT